MAAPGESIGLVGLPEVRAPPVTSTPRLPKESSGPPRAPPFPPIPPFPTALWHSPSLRTLCAALHVDDQPLGLPEAPAALLTCHEFLGRLRDARRAALASTAAAAGAPVPRGRAASMPLVPVTPRSAGPRPRYGLLSFCCKMMIVCLFLL